VDNATTFWAPQSNAELITFSAPKTLVLMHSNGLYSAAGNRKLDFSVVRYGNVMGSRGSVIPFFIAKAKEKVLPITDDRMTRFNITLDEGVDMVLYAIENSWGGEIFVPKIPSYKITDVAEAIGPSCEQKIVGIRPGEKIHEEMITETDALNTLDCGKYYVILPATPNWDIEKYKTTFKAEYVPMGFKYNSGANSQWIGVEELRGLIKEHVDSTFGPT